MGSDENAWLLVVGFLVPRQPKMYESDLLWQVPVEEAGVASYLLRIALFGSIRVPGSAQHILSTSEGINW